MQSKSVSVVVILLSFLLLHSQPLFAQTNQSADDNQFDKTARIGVLAFRGEEAARSQWEPLIAYLSATIDGWNFELVPVTLSSVQREIDTKTISFLITNPGHYVTLAADNELTALATRERWVKLAGKHISKFGTVIFVKAGSAIASLNDIKGKKLAAVSPNAFGGFQLAWNELNQQGVDAFRDLKSLRFLGFPHDQIIKAVADEDVDVGIIRSGLLEILADEGSINLDEFRVLNPQTHPEFPYQVSSALFSEWPFASLPSVDKRLREQVLIALLESQEDAIAAEYKLEDLWSTPLSYEEARSLVGSYQGRLASGTLQNNTGSPTTTLLIALASLAAFAVLAIYFFQRQLGLSRQANVNEAIAMASNEFQPYEEKLQSLTTREKEVLQLICNGYQTKNIAAKLGISPKTVEFHRTNLLQKTDAGTTAHLVQIATRLGYDQGFPLG